MIRPIQNIIARLRARRASYRAFRRLAAPWVWDGKSQSWTNVDTGSVIYKIEGAYTLEANRASMQRHFATFRRAVEDEASL